MEILYVIEMKKAVWRMSNHKTKRQTDIFLSDLNRLTESSKIFIKETDLINEDGYLSPVEDENVENTNNL